MPSKRPRLRGVQGRRGPKGLTGLTGRRGPAGPSGPKVTRRDIFVAVAVEFRKIHTQFDDMRKQLDVQLTRMAQIQQQLNQIHTLVKEAR